ncbi:MAG: hypothetical protein IJ220_00165 [Clostridia bacterium]|nr:hypothetical protein [Clostridia bacterium]
MGISLKDIFKNDEEKLVKDRRNTAIRNMIIFSLVVVVLLIITLTYKFWGNADDTRRIALTQDMQSIQFAMNNRVNSRINSNSSENYPGISLEEEPQTLNINGYEEEYRYGYYYLASGDLQEIATVLNLPNERYFVNYETGDVVNVDGVKYKKKRYHSIDDIVAIFKNEPVPSDSVVVINTASDLNKIRQKPRGYYKLSGNIDMSEYASAEGWEPIQEFNGTFDGRGYTISNLTINRPTKSNVGLFGEVQGDAQISNINFEDVKIIGGEYTGTLAGYCSGTITNVHIANGDITGMRSAAGAIVGAYGISKMSNCTIKANVDGDSEVGGAIGTLYSGIVNRVSFDGNVTATKDVGGLVGLVRVSTASTEISECVARAAVNGKNNLGGFVGELEMTSNNTINVIDSYAIGSIETGESNIGGMFGYIYAAQGTPTIRLENLYADVSVVVKGQTSGGFIGNSAVSNSTTKNAIECYWKKDLAPGEELESTGTYTQGSEFTSKAKTPVEIMMRREYTDWDFAKVWDIKERETSAFLRWENNYKVEDKDAKK